MLLILAVGYCASAQHGLELLKPLLGHNLGRAKSVFADQIDDKEHDAAENQPPKGEPKQNENNVRSSDVE